MTPPTGDVYLRVAEAAKLLHVSPKTLDRWAREGRVPYIVTLGGHRRFLLGDVLAVAEQMANPTPLDTNAKSPNRPGRSPEK